MAIKDSKTRLDYIDKETDTESNLGDYGVRKYDSFTGLFITPDVLFEKYAGWSPYHYSLDNPVSYLDGNGYELVLAGSPTALNKVNSVVLNGTGGLFGTTTNSSGSTLLQSTGIQGPMTQSQSAFYNQLQITTDLSNPMVNIGISESNSTLIGHYVKEEIDINDIINMGNGECLNSSSAFIHEIAEQTEKQFNGLLNNEEGYKRAHLFGVSIENAVSGAERIDIGINKATTYTSSKKNGQIHIEYLYNSKNTMKIIDIDDNNVKGIIK